MFRCNYLFNTVVVLLFGVFHLQIYSTNGTPAFTCIGGQDIPQDMFEAFCWVHSTYTEAYDQKKMNNFQLFYSLLWLDVALIMLPYLVWRLLDNQWLLKAVNEMLDGDKDRDESSRLLRLFTKHFCHTLNTSGPNVLWFNMLELVNFGMVLLNMALLLWTLDTTPTEMVENVFQFKESYLEQMFPVQVHCMLQHNGLGGVLSDQEGTLCIVPQNKINQIVFVWLTIWNIVLLSAGVLNTAWRVLTFALPWVRYKHLLTTAGPLAVKGDVMKLAKKLCYSDYVVVTSIGSHCNCLLYNEFLREAITSDREDSIDNET